MEDYVVIGSLKGRIHLIIGCSIFVAIGIWMTASGFADGDPEEWHWGALTIAFFSLFFFFIPFFWRRKLLEVTKEGFYERTTFFSQNNRIIPWSQVTKLRVTDMGVPVLGVFLKDQQYLLNGHNWLFQKMVRLHGSEGAGQILISFDNAGDVDPTMAIIPMIKHCQAAIPNAEIRVKQHKDGVTYMAELIE